MNTKCCLLCQIHLLLNLPVELYKDSVLSTCTQVPVQTLPVAACGHMTCVPEWEARAVRERKRSAREEMRPRLAKIGQGLWIISAASRGDGKKADSW